MSTTRGRKRKLDLAAQTLLCQLVAAGASIAAAADKVGVTLRTVQREVKDNEDFEHDLRLAEEAAPVDPLKLMQAAAKAHWRAAAWLLERTDPERYGKRPAGACSADQFHKALAAVLEAALEAADPASRRSIYQAAQAVVDDAMRRIFPLQARSHYAPPKGLRRNVLTSEQEMNAYLDEIAAKYQTPEPEPEPVAAPNAEPYPEPVAPARAPTSVPNNPPQAQSNGAPPRRQPAPGIMSPKIDFHESGNFDLCGDFPAGGNPATVEYFLDTFAKKLRRALAERQRHEAAHNAAPNGVHSNGAAPPRR